MFNFGGGRNSISLLSLRWYLYSSTFLRILFTIILVEVATKKHILKCQLNEIL